MARCMAVQTVVVVPAAKVEPGSPTCTRHAGGTESGAQQTVVADLIAAFWGDWAGMEHTPWLAAAPLRPAATPMSIAAL